MNTLKQAQPVGRWVRWGRMRLRVVGGKLVAGLGAALYAVAAFNAANEAYEGSLSFEERLQRTGRVRYC